MRFLLPLFSYLLLCFFPPLFPARITPTPTVNQTTSATWQNFTKFLDLQKGCNITGISDLKKYFHRFGYLPSPVNLSDDFFGSSMESAVCHYQQNLGLPVSGKLDGETLHLIMSPRCGISDHYHPPAAVPGSKFRTTGRFTFFTGRPRWFERAPVVLTYAFSPNHTVDYLTKQEIQDVFSRAFAHWARVIPINFTEVEKYSTAQIKIGFYFGDHGDGEPFDGVLGILAHAFSPESGKLHLDGAERWAIDFGTEKSKVAVDLESVATHEIGHVLGLAHSSVKGSMMYPSVSPRKYKRELTIDDVTGVQTLYGSNPSFTPDSLASSESSADSSGGSYDGIGKWWWLAVILGLLV